MKKINYSEQTYTVNNREGFELTTALRLWKAKYADDYRDFQKEVITNKSLNDFDQFVQECWDSITPVTVEEALLLENTEDRRVYFNAIGIEKLFKQLDPKLLDKQIIKKKRTRWDKDDKEYINEFEDVYELYEIQASKLFTADRWGNLSTNHVYAVRCWCTTTNREYWLYVPKEAALGDRWWQNGEDGATPDAIRAIAWTIRVDVPKEDIEKIYRQGDIIVTKLKDDYKVTTASSRQYHLDKDSYLSLIYSET